MFDDKTLDRDDTPAASGCLHGSVSWADLERFSLTRTFSLSPLGNSHWHVGLRLEVPASRPGLRLSELTPDYHLDPVQHAGSLFWSRLRPSSVGPTEYSGTGETFPCYFHMRIVDQHHHGHACSATARTTSTILLHRLPAMVSSVASLSSPPGAPTFSPPPLVGTQKDGVFRGPSGDPAGPGHLAINLLVSSTVPYRLSTA